MESLKASGSPVPALAVAGFIGSVLLADGFQLGQRPADGSARGLVTLLVTALSVAFGVFVSKGYTKPKHVDPWVILPPNVDPHETKPSPLAIVVRAVFGAVVATAAVALMLRLVVWSGGFEHIVASVAVGTLAWTPILLVLLHLHHRTARSRGGSLVRACDERAVWFMLSAVALLGSIVIGLVPESPGLPAHRSAARAIGILALLLMPWFAGRNVFALIRAWRLARSSEALRRRTEEIPPQLDVLDLGVGNEVFEERAGGSAYRMAPATRVVLGSPNRTLQIVRREAAALAALACLGVGLFAARGLS